MTHPPIAAGPVTLRRWRDSDRLKLVAEANNKAVWRNMTHLFPHPYTEEDAKFWLERCLAQDPPLDLVVALDDELIGVGGVTAPGEGVGRHSASIGYWLGQNHWGRGIGTAVSGAMLRYGFETLDVERIQAEVFGWNPASARVLEKNGFVLDGRRRKAIFKDGEFVDELIYSILRSDAT